jgi:hypothetical protein
MKKIFFLLVILFFAGFAVFNSCKKEYSCEGCKEGNKPPIAIAGPDQVITLPTDSVLLDVNNSSDPDGMISSYLWTKISGPSSFNILKLSDSITKVKALVAGTYQFELKVTDNGGLSAKDTMRIIVDSVLTTNHPPIANAGTDQTITLPTNTLNLDGSGTTDPENNITSYAWTKISGPSSFNITNANAVQTAITNLVQGIYQFELKVTDAGLLFSKDTIQVTVNPSDTPPNTTSLGCNASMLVIGRLPTPGWVKYSVTAGTKILFTRGPGEVDIYDTLTHNWKTVNGMHATEYYGSGSKAATVGNKIVFVANNSTDPGQGQLVNVYDAGSDSWTITHLSGYRSSYAMATSDNKVFYAGGNELKKLDIYDAVSNSWSVANFIEARIFGMRAVSFGNKVFFAGGYVVRYDSLVLSCDDFGNNCDSVPALVSSDRIDILDITTNTWSVAYLSEGRGDLGTAIIGNKIFFIGGDKGEGGSSHKMDFYDAANNSWSSIDFGPPGTVGLNERPDGINIVGTKILIGLGFRGDQIHIYDAANNTWSVSQMPFPHETNMHEAGLVTALGNKLLFFLQYVQDESHSRGIDIYDASTNTWCHTQLDFNLVRTGMVKVGNRVYVAGGKTMSSGCCNYDTLLDTVWHLNF